MREEDRRREGGEEIRTEKREEEETRDKRKRCPKVTYEMLVLSLSDGRKTRAEPVVKRRQSEVALKSCWLTSRRREAGGAAV